MIMQGPSDDAKINDFITRSLRDVADGDYIAARALYRLRLDNQFLWASLQAVEKYLKAILGYQRADARKLVHNIANALEKVRTLPNISIPARIDNFVRELGWQGLNRYFEHPFSTEWVGLPELDETVYHLRRHCRAITTNAEMPIQGFLEEVLASDTRARADLVWKNRFFGPRRNRKITFSRRVSLAWPSNFLYPEIFPELLKFIYFSKRVRQHLVRVLARRPNGKLAGRHSGIKTVNYTLPPQDVY